MTVLHFYSTAKTQNAKLLFLSTFAPLRLCAFARDHKSVKTTFWFSMNIDHLKELTDPLLSVQAAIFRIRFEAGQTWRLTGTEKALRGRLGFDLKRMCCTLPGFRQCVCTECAMLKGCLYIRLFAPVYEGPEIDKNGNKKPAVPSVRPFVMHSDCPEGKSSLEPGQSGNLESVLFGPAVQYCSLFIEATVSALHHFHLHAKEITLASPISAGSDNAAGEPGDTDNNLSHSLTEWCGDFANQENRDILNLEFLSPVQIKDRGKIVSHALCFPVLIRSLLRRLRDLKKAFGDDGDMGKTGRDFFDMAARVETVENGLYWSRRKRYSYRQEQYVAIEPSEKKI